MLAAGKLRHKLILEELQNIADSSGNVQNSRGAVRQQWVAIANVWAAIEPLSAREFTAAQVEQSKVGCRIIIRYRDDVTAEMRFRHEAKKMYYNIEGVLSDLDSGLEYITLPCSNGVRYDDGDVPSVDNFLLQDDFTSFILQDDGVSFITQG